MPKDEKISSTPAELAFEIKMIRKAESSQTIIIVEGATDRKFLKDLVVKESAIIPSGGKDKALETVRKLDSKPIDGVFAILDADFALIVGGLPTTTYINIFLTDATDLETMLFQSPALEKLLQNTLSESLSSKIDDLCVKLRRTVVDLAIWVGYLRLIDHHHRDYNLSLKQISFEVVIDTKHFTIDKNKLVDAVLTSSKSSKREILDKIEDFHLQRYETWHVCRGHDVLGITTVVLPYLVEREYREKLSGKVRVQTQANELSRMLRMAYELAFFKNTQLYVSLKQWEVDNPPFKVLKD